MSQAGVGLVRPAAAAREDAGHGLVELWKSRHLDEEHSSHFGIVEVVYEGIKCLAGSCPGLPTPRPPAPDTYWQVLERKASVSRAPPEAAAALRISCGVENPSCQGTPIRRT